MPELDEQFQQAMVRVMSLPKRPDNDTLLQLYSLYKQGAEGDVHGAKPGFFDFVGTAKYQAWRSLQGLAGDEAKRRYIGLVNSLFD